MGYEAVNGLHHGVQAEVLGRQGKDLRIQALQKESEASQLYGNNAKKMYLYHRARPT